MLDHHTDSPHTDSLQADPSVMGGNRTKRRGGFLTTLAAGTVALSAAACGGQAGASPNAAPSPDSSRPIATGTAKPGGGESSGAELDYDSWRPTDGVELNQHPFPYVIGDETYIGIDAARKACEVPVAEHPDPEDAFKQLADVFGLWQHAGQTREERRRYSELAVKDAAAKEITFGITAAVQNAYNPLFTECLFGKGANTNLDVAWAATHWGKTARLNGADYTNNPDGFSVTAGWDIESANPLGRGDYEVLARLHLDTQGGADHAVDFKYPAKLIISPVSGDDGRKVWKVISVFGTGQK